MLNVESFANVAAATTKMGFTDKELAEIVKVYDCLVAFFAKRQEHFVLSGLRREREVFKGFIEERERYKL